MPGRGLCRLGKLWLGVLLGAFTAVADLAFLLVVGLALLPVLPWRPRRERLLTRTGAYASRLAGLERARLATFLGGADAARPTGDRRALGYLAVRVPVGLLGGAIWVLLLYGMATGAVLVTGWARGTRPDDIPPTWPIVLYAAAAGAVLLFLALQGLAGVAGLEDRVARRFLGPSAREVLQGRISELAASRAGIVAAVDSERRRIERDLHDGVQQRLVALAMLLGRTRRSSDPAAHADLLRQAHEESQEVLSDLREVAWRIYPSALDTLGLDDALAAVAERSAVPVRIRSDLVVPLPARVETAVYFVVCETVTNAAKHSGATAISVDLAESADHRLVRVRIRDDGRGGADPAGPGLAGLARRIAALDGSFEVDSPAGGPTTVTTEVPCG